MSAFPDPRGKKARDLFPDAVAPEAALAGLWLYHGNPDEAHKIAQDLHSPEGSLWHAILHREEPDPSNASYWFRRVGASHPCYEDIAAAAREILKRYPNAGFQVGKTWDPHAFIDFCETTRAGNDRQATQAAAEIREAEWRIIFEYCARPRA